MAHKLVSYPTPSLLSINVLAYSADPRISSALTTTMDEQPKDLAGHDLSRSLLRDIFDGLGNNRPKETFCYIADDVQCVLIQAQPTAWRVADCGRKRSTDGQ